MQRPIIPLNSKLPAASVAGPSPKPPDRPFTSGGSSDRESLAGIADFLLRLHQQTDTRRICYTIVNELRKLTDSDRVMIALQRRFGPRVEAVSGLASIDSRSPIIRAAAGLARRSVLEGTTWYAEGEQGNVEDDPSFRHFLDVSHSRTVAVLPLREPVAEGEPPDPFGILICERFDRRPFDVELRRQLEIVCQHSSIAIAKSMDFERLPFLSVMLGLRRRLRRSGVAALLKVAAGMLAIGLLVAGLVWPVDFVVIATGAIQPVQRRDIFAPSDGIVEELHLKHDSKLRAGDVLLRIHNDELEFEITRILGEIQTAQQRLVALQTSRLENSLARRTEVDPTRVAGEEEQLKQALKGLELQLAHRESQRQELAVTSPIDGVLLTWDVERLLLSRPVRAGQRLVTVADLTSDWQLELEVADRDVGHVLAARRVAREPIPISFRLAAQPEKTVEARLTEVADWTEATRANRSAVRMIASVDAVDRNRVRPGAAATARIHLGTRSRAFVWFRDIIEFLRVRLWL